MIQNQFQNIMDLHKKREDLQNKKRMIAFKMSCKNH